VKSSLTPDESETVSGQNLVDGLEVSHTAALAVTRATGGDTLGLGARVERTARVTGLGADVGLGEASDTALCVGHRRANGADGVAVDTSGGAGAADAGADGGGGAAGDGDGSTAVVVDAALEGVAGATADVAVVVAGERGSREGSDGSTSRGGGSRAGGTAVAGRDEASGDRETDRAASRVVDVVSVTTADGGEGGGQSINDLDLELGLLEAGALGQVSSLSGAVLEGLKDELVGGNVDPVGGDSSGSTLFALAKGGIEVHRVKLLLGILELRDRSVNLDCLGASSSDLRGQGVVSDGDVKVAIDEPSTGKARLGLELVNDLGGLELAGNTNVSLLGIKSQVALHGSQDRRVEAVGSGGRGAIDDGQEGRDGSEECGDLHS
jgi:hypothetical protein